MEFVCLVGLPMALIAISWQMESKYGISFDVSYLV